MIDKLKYNITDNDLPQLFSNIENYLEINTQIIKELLKIDSKYCKIKVDTELLKDIINNFKNQKLDIKHQQKFFIKYNGNPCITLNLCILAILTKNIIVLDYQDNMIGINSYLIQMVNNVLKTYNTEQLIYHKKMNESDVEKIICIDDINQYNIYLQRSIENVKFYSFDYIDYYSDCEGYEELEYLIHKFADENKIPIEVYSELNLNEAVQMIKNGFGKNVVVLTNNEETKKCFEENIKREKLYINQNPFKENIRMINKDIFYI